MKIIINEELKGKRIDSFISEYNTELTRSTVQRLIEETQITVNGKKTKPSYKTNVNDEILINIPEPKEVDLKPQDIPIEILFEDNQYFCHIVNG